MIICVSSKTFTMSLVNITQFIEKERQSGTPNEFWKSENISEHRVNTQSVFDNCLTATSYFVSDDQRFKSISESTKSNEGTRNDGNLTGNLEKDLESSANCFPSCDDLDETDYFDSEDEYWDSLRSKNIEEELCAYCLCHHIPRSVEESEYCPLEEVYDMYPAFTRVVQKFAKENNFEIHDVYGDDACLFRAIADQFEINGCPGHTELSLRQTAIDQLKGDPKRYGLHLSSSHVEDTLEEYLQKMQKATKWDNHPILQALAGVFVLEIYVFYFVDSHSKQSVITSKTNATGQKFHMYLGCNEEAHFFSLRPLQWMTELPYRAQIYRMLVVCTEKIFEERRQLLHNKMAVVSQGHFPKDHLDNCFKYVLQLIQNETSHLRVTNDTNVERSYIFKSYSGKDLEPEESGEIRRKLVDDGVEVDSVSGIPLLHLNFIIKHIFPYNMFYGVRMKPPLLRIGEIYFHHVCHFSNPQSITLRDISRTQKMIKLQMKRQLKISYMIVVLTRNKKAIYDNDFVADDAQVDLVFIDSSNTLPGYCRLRLASSLNFADENVARIGSNIYQKAFQITETLRSQVDAGRRRKVQYIGVPCKSFPFVRRWEKNKRSDFPSGTVIDSIIKNGCTLIPNPHPKSTRPDLEWQFNFSIAETLIFSSLTDGQMYGFLVLNVLLENMTNHLHVPFQTQYLVAVFFLACEELSCRAWDVNFSGCFLYVLGSLLSFLKANFLPDYFIPERNLIDSHRKDDIGTLCCIVEYIRLFPACAVQIVAEKYGYTYGTNLIKRILLNREYFPDRTKFPVIFDESFGPLTIATAKIMAKMGFYGVSIQILENRFEQSLLTPQSLLRQSSFNFCDFFMSALMEIKQQSSRVNLARIFDLNMGSNISDLVIETGRRSLQAYLPWAVDARIGCIKVPLDKTGNLTEIASFLYGYSKSEYWKRNAILAELAVTTSIRCIQETLKENSLNVESIRDLGLGTEVKDEDRTLQRKLIPLYVHLYSVSLLDYEVYPLLYYLDDVEDICNLFPEMAGVVSSMFSDAFKPEKSWKYAKMMNAYFHDRDAAA